MINEEYTQRDLKKAKNNCIGVVLCVLFFALLVIICTPLCKKELDEEIKEAQSSVYMEFTFEKYVSGGGRHGSNDGKIYVKELDEPICVRYPAAFFNKFVLHDIKEGMKIRCYVVKMPEKLMYSYKVVHFETEEKVIFTVDDYIETATRVTDRIITVLIVISVIICVICIPLLFRYRKKYFIAKQELSRVEQEEKRKELK